MTRGRKNWGIEVKAAASVTSRDWRGLARLSDRCGKDFERGILFYEGRDILPLPDKRMLAVPLRELGGSGLHQAGRWLNNRAENSHLPLLKRCSYLPLRNPLACARKASQPGARFHGLRTKPQGIQSPSHSKFQAVSSCRRSIGSESRSQRSWKAERLRFISSLCCA